MPLPPAKKQKTLACIRQIQVHKLWTKVYSQKGLTAVYLTVLSDLDEDVYSLKQFNTELIVAATVQCIKFINSDADLPNTLPPGMSARFRMGASLANFVQVCFFVCLPVCQLVFVVVVFNRDIYRLHIGDLLSNGKRDVWNWKIRSSP